MGVVDMCGHDSQEWVWILPAWAWPTLAWPPYKRVLRGRDLLGCMKDQFGSNIFLMQTSSELIL